MRWLVVLVLVAGCASPAETAADDLDEQVPDAPEPDPWGGADRIMILDRLPANTLPGHEMDVLCTMGGGVMFPRSGDGRVLPGSSHIEITVQAPPTSTGIQVGWVVDDAPGYDEVSQDGISWTGVVANGVQVFEVPVAPDATEQPDGDPLWAFYMRTNLFAAPQDCYTGVSAGEYGFAVEAVRGSVD